MTMRRSSTWNIVALLALLAVFTCPTSGAAQTTPASGVQITVDGVYQGRATTINCDSASMSCPVNGSIADISSSGGGGGGAPTNATYITQTPNATLSNEQALSLLGTGLMFSTTGTGVVSIYGGTTPCSAGDFISAISGAGAATCGTPAGSGTVTTTGSPANGNLTKFSGATSITNGDLSGDVTTSGTLAATIANNAVTYAKLQDVSAASKLLGRGDSGAGDPQEITLGSGLTMTGTTLSATTGGGGTVTHTAGALTANQVVIGNGSDDIKVLGAAGTTTTLLHGNAGGAPSFGSVVSADMNITTTSCTNQVVTAISAGGVGTCSTVANAALANSAITVTGTANRVTVSGSPVSLGGTVTLNAPQDIHTAATPTFASETLTANTNQLTLGTTNTTTVTMAALGASRTFTLPDANSNPIRPLTCGAGDFVSAIAGTGVLTCTTPSGGGAPTTAGYWTKTADAGLSNEFDMSSLATGYVKVTTGTGVPSSQAVPIPVADGGTGLTSGTSGGVLAYTASGTLASSGALTANLPVIGGGAGVAPTVGTRSGNTTQYVTTTGTQTSGDCVKIDANGNHVANGSACGGGGGSSETVGVVASDVTHAQSSTTLTDVTGLSASICTASTEVWQFSLWLRMTAANATADYKFAWTFPTGVTMSWQSIDSFNAPAPGGTPTGEKVQTDTYPSGSFNGTSLIQFAGFVYCSTTSGTLQFQFAQNTSNGSDITVKKGSVLRILKVIN